MASAVKYLSVSGLLLFGTTTSLFAKLVYELKSEGLDGETHNFRKPWTMTTVMFLGMTLCLPIAYFQQYMQQKRAAQQSSDDNDMDVPMLEESNSQVKPWTLKGELKEMALISIPTVFDLIATVLMNIGLLSVTASVYQMMRGAEMIFAAIFAILFLKRHLNKYHFGGIALCVVGICCVGLASTLSGAGGAVTVDRWHIVLGMFLIIVSQCVQAGQLTFEDFFMADLDIQPLKVVGYEGLVGAIIMCGVMLPIVQFVSGEDGHGIHEDTYDTIAMILNNPVLMAILIIDMFALLMYNVSGMAVTGCLGAVFRTVLETMRTLFVWVLDLILFYTIGGLGESWNNYSLIQALGFVILVSGTVVYGKGDEQSYKEELTAAGLLPAPEDKEAGIQEGSSQPMPMPTTTQPMVIGATPQSSSYRSTMAINAVDPTGSYRGPGSYMDGAGSLNRRSFHNSYRHGSLRH